MGATLSHKCQRDRAYFLHPRNAALLEFQLRRVELLPVAGALFVLLALVQHAEALVEFLTHCAWEARKLFFLSGKVAPV